MKLEITRPGLPKNFAQADIALLVP